MARERISLVEDSVKKAHTLEQQIRVGEITADNFSLLPAADQQEVNRILFKIASENINEYAGLSVLEFVTFAFMRIANKKMNGLSLTAEDQEIQDSLDRILAAHEITDTNLSKVNWLFDYLQYAEYHAQGILQNRRDHITRKQQVTGQV